MVQGSSGLGESQRTVLELLREHGEFPGWVWPRHPRCRTVAVLESLVERRLVEKRDGVYRPVEVVGQPEGGA
jgi:hypothetical protein